MCLLCLRCVALHTHDRRHKRRKPGPRRARVREAYTSSSVFCGQPARPASFYVLFPEDEESYDMYSIWWSWCSSDFSCLPCVASPAETSCAVQPWSEMPQQWRHAVARDALPACLAGQHRSLNGANSFGRACDAQQARKNNRFGLLSLPVRANNTRG